MKKRMNISLLVTALVIVSSAMAQQTRQSNLYDYNKFGFNPAYAGRTGCTEINFSHMNQWIKVDGAPLTNFLSANTRLGKNFGIGANLILDRAGLMQQFSSSLSASYGLTFSKHHHVRLGITGGFFQVQVDPTDAIAFDVGDDIIEGGIQSSNALNTQAGIYYSFKGLELSFSSQQLIETRSNVTYPGLDGYGLKRHLVGYIAYAYPINDKFTLKPNLMYKGIGVVNQFDINADMSYNNFVFGGIGYRTGVGVLGRVGVNIKDLFFISYSYEIPMQNIASYGSGSHEIGLGLKFCKKPKEEPELVISRVDTVFVVKEIVDTVYIETIDTLYLQPEKVSDSIVQKALFKASQSLEFENDKAIIRKHSYGDLESLANILLIRKDLRITMAGHTDDNGSEEYNMTLSKNRVEAVKDFLIANGINPNRIKTSHYGESKPIADNTTEEGRGKNRRVEMEVIVIE